MRHKVIKMEIESKLSVVDARDAYIKWNNQQSKKIPDIAGEELSRYLHLLPLIFHINHKLLPGYVGSDAPAGIYAYKPENETLDYARGLSNKFRYQQEGIIKNSSIDAMYLHRHLIDGATITCWLFYNLKLSEDQVRILKAKAEKVTKWLLSRGFNLGFFCCSTEDFNNDDFRPEHSNKEIFLDYFYSQSILLAGKYPVWWLVPPEEEVNYESFVKHIRQARFVDNDDFIDLGCIENKERGDLVRYAIEKVQKIKQSAEISLVELLIIDRKNTLWPRIDGLSLRVKKNLYLKRESSRAIDCLVELMHETFKQYSPGSHTLKPTQLFYRLKYLDGKLNSEIIDEFVGTEYQQSVSAAGIDRIIDYLKLLKAINHEVRQIFSNIVTQYTSQNNVDDIDKALAISARNMLVFLSDATNNVPLYNFVDRSDMVFNRILLRNNSPVSSSGYWDLVLKTEQGQEKIIQRFSSLLGLLAWCWLNRLVNHSTQVSIDCTDQRIRQTDARYVLETLINQLNPELVSVIPAKEYESEVRPLQSLLFINLDAKNGGSAKVSASDDPLSFGDNATNLVTHCDQLIVNSWGEVYTKNFTGNEGVIKCLCEWTHSAPLDGMSRPQNINVFGHGTGDSTYMSQRINQVYSEMTGFFYTDKQYAGRFILRLGSDYYIVCSENMMLAPKLLGDRKKFISYLEFPLEKFCMTAIEKYAYAEYPIREIYQSNKINTVQVFYRLSGRYCRTWVLDEKGTLWQETSDMFELDSYFTHWLYVYRNFIRRIAEITGEGKYSPGFEMYKVSISPFGGVDLYAVNAESISGKKNFIDVRVSIETEANLDQLSLVCGGKLFDYKTFTQNVLVECIEYISLRIVTEGFMPVYVTDIDVPLRLFNVSRKDQVQLSHLLKFKRNFEHRINKLLDI